MKRFVITLAALALAGGAGAWSSSSAATRFGTTCSTDNACPLSSAQAAKTLGATIQRIRVPLANNAGKFADIAAAKADGMHVQINIPDNCGAVDDASWEAEIKGLIAKAVATGAKIDALALGNEPDRDERCSAAAYLADLTRFVAIAHGFHVPATDGGVSYSGIMLAYNGSPQTEPRRAARQAKVMALHAGLAQTGEDWPNVHYYGPAAQMVQVATWWANGRTPVINEMGSRRLDPAEIAGLVAAAKTLHAPFAIALVAQGKGGGRAMGLVDPTGKPNVNGEAFRTNVATAP
jgi:hypothetical protein